MSFIFLFCPSFFLCFLGLCTLPEIKSISVYQPPFLTLFLARKSNILFSKTFYLFLNWWKYRSYQLLTSFLSCLLVLYHTYFILINVTTSFGWLIFHIYIPFYPFKTRFIFMYLSNDIHYCYLIITVQDTNSKWKKFIMSSNS